MTLPKQAERTSDATITLAVECPSMKADSFQRWYFRMVPVLFPRRLFDWLNIRVTRFGARHATRQSLAVEYDKAHAMALKALTSVSDQEFSKSLNYPDWDPLLSGEATLEQLFHYIKAHFDGHAAQIRKVLSYDERK